MRIAFDTMAKSSPVQRLRVLNSLLSVIHPADPEKSVEIRKAVDFYINELEEVEAEDQQLRKFAQDILNIHIKDYRVEALCFWTIDPEEREILWLRNSFLEKLEALKTFAVATVVVFGLQEAVSRNQKYWTQKVESEYNELRDYLDQVAAEWQPAGYHLNLIYI